MSMGTGGVADKGHSRQILLYFKIVTFSLV